MAAKAASAIPQCYMGNHGLCKRVSYICHGGATSTYQFPYLPADVRSKLKMSTDDEQTVLKLLDKRIGKEAMEKTKYGTSTQKSESMNHAFAMTNPNGTLTFSRNAESRDHSAVHLVNNGHANSIVKKCESAGCPVTACSPAAKALDKMEKKRNITLKGPKETSTKNVRHNVDQNDFICIMLHRCCINVAN